MMVKFWAVVGSAAFASVVTFALTYPWDCSALLSEGCETILGPTPMSKDGAGEITAMLGFLAGFSGWVAADFGSKG